jgi:tetratricopeptide (TPR) repeat protein
MDSCKRLAGPALIFLCILSTLARAQSQDVHTAALNRDPLVREGFQHFYDLDYDGSLKIFQKVLQQHPNDPLAVDYVLSTTIFRELYKEDLLDTTLYAHDGFLTGKHVTSEDPAVKTQVDDLSDRAISLADDRVKANPNDVDALFARAMARSLKAAYIGLAERGFIGGLHLALSARSDDERVLQIDPKYIDAKMVIGIHLFVVGALPLPLKLMAGMVGIHGDKSRGMALLEECAKYGVITSVESRTTMMIFLRHEARYQDAIKVAESLRTDYPHDFLFALEVANLYKDAGNAPVAIREYRSVLDQANKPGFYFSAHPELAWFGLAETLYGQNDKSGALAAFRQADVQPTIGVDLKRRVELAINLLQSQGVK